MKQILDSLGIKAKISDFLSPKNSFNKIIYAQNINIYLQLPKKGNGSNKKLGQGK